MTSAIFESDVSTPRNDATFRSGVFKYNTTCCSKFKNFGQTILDPNCPMECIKYDEFNNSRDLVLETATQLPSPTVIVEEIHCAGSSVGRTSGTFGTNNVELSHENEDWFRIIGAESCSGNVVCEIWVVDHFSRGDHVALKIPIYRDCLIGSCSCTYFISGV